MKISKIIHILLQITFLLIFPWVMGQPKSYGEIINSLKPLERDKLIFDITKTTNTNTDSSEAETLDFMKTEDGTPQVFYYTRDGLHYNGSGFIEGASPQKDSTKLTWANETIPVSFMLKAASYQSIVRALAPGKIEFALGGSDPNPKNGSAQPGVQIISVIFNIREWDSKLSPPPGPQRLKSLRSLFQSQWPYISIGVEYDYHPERAKYFHIAKMISLFQVIILNVDISPYEFLLSYSQFKSTLRGVLDRSYDFIQLINPNCTPHLRVSFPGREKLEERVYLSEGLYEDVPFYRDRDIGEEEYRKYFFYLLQFSAFWVGEGEREPVILEAFPANLVDKEGFAGVDFKELIEIPIPRFNKAGTCRLKAALDHVRYSGFKRVIVEEGFISENKCVMEGATSCPRNLTESEICNRPILHNSSLSLPDASFQYNVNIADMDFQQDVVKFTQNAARSGLPWKGVEFTLYAAGQSADVVSSKLRFLLVSLPSGIIIGCNSHQGLRFRKNEGNSGNYTIIIPTSLKLCGDLWNHSGVIIWNVMPDKGDLYSLTRNLIVLEAKRQEFSQMYKGKSVKLRVYLKPPLNTLSVYCNPQVKTYNEMAEVIINFGRVHSIPLELADVLGYISDYHSGWRVLQTVGEVDMDRTKFPVFVARDYPEMFLLGEFKIDPCISWTREVTKEGVHLDYEQAGVWINLEGFRNGSGSLTKEELEILMLFAFHKFTLIELGPIGTTDKLDQMLHILGKGDFLEKVEVEVGKPFELYIGVNGAEIFEGNGTGLDMGRFDNLEIKPTGVHIDILSWNAQATSDDSHFERLRNNGVLLGLTLEDCLEEMNRGFGRVKKLQPFHIPIDYILCNINHPVEATNLNVEEMTQYLDTTLYVKKYFDRLFPKENNKSIELLFRLNPVPSRTTTPEERTVTVHGKAEKVVRNQTSDFLAFSADASQYAGLNKIKIFICPAFDDMDGARARWWTITDFGRLANPSVFVEKEAEQSKQDNWRPKMKKPGESEMLNPMEVIVIGLALLLLILISVALFIRLRYRKQFGLLTRKEVDVFRYGVDVDVNDPGIDKRVFENMKFPKEFEIPKRRFILQNLIGRGNFGLAYKATLSNEGYDETTTIAIKMPHPDSSKESFKCMLSELKVLCYVGVHPNVILFLGAYIKEIGTGVAYIATEFCENGSLQDYLQKSCSELINTDGMMPTTLPRTVGCMLTRFAHEIALGMEYIASRKIVHGDLSARNVLLGLNLDCKIADFGLSRKLYEYQVYIQKSSVPLPWRWSAIESLRRSEFTVKSDVWSYGITLWEIFSLGNVPYPGLSLTEEFLKDVEAGYRMSAPAFSSIEVFEIMTMCWNLSPLERPTFTELASRFMGMRDADYISIVRG